MSIGRMPEPTKDRTSSLGNPRESHRISCKKETTRSGIAPLSALVLAKQDHSSLLQRVLQSHGFAVSLAQGVDLAEKMCAHQRFDLAVYDQDVNGALDLAREGRLTSRPRVSVGLLGASTEIQVPGLRVHFVVRKPFTDDIFAKTVRAAYGPIVADRRLSFRHEVNVKADCKIRHRGELRALEGVRIVNLSQTGLCLHASEMLPQGVTAELTFRLPQTDIQVQLVGAVIWAHISGRAGLKFCELSSEEQHKLEKWHELALPDFRFTPA